jgi:uncharacterized membrane protein YvbJ
MANMMKCKTCGKAIATTANTCPGCGAPNTKPTGMATSITRILFMTAAILSLIPCLLLFGVFGLVVPVVCFVIAVCLK